MGLDTSQEALDEAGRGEPTLAEARLALLKDLRALEVSDNAGDLAKHLLSSRLVPAKAALDAVHVAVASVHGMDFLATWNFKHIANPHIQTRLRLVVAEFGVHLPVICTPEELLNDEDD